MLTLNQQELKLDLSSMDSKTKKDKERPVKKAKSMASLDFRKFSPRKISINLYNSKISPKRKNEKKNKDKKSKKKNKRKKNKPKKKLSVDTKKPEFNKRTSKSPRFLQSKAKKTDKSKSSDETSVKSKSSRDLRTLYSRNSSVSNDGKSILRRQGYYREVRGNKRKIKSITGMNSEELEIVIESFNGPRLLDISNLKSTSLCSSNNSKKSISLSNTDRTASTVIESEESEKIYPFTLTPSEISFEKRETENNLDNFSSASEYERIGDYSEVITKKDELYQKNYKGEENQYVYRKGETSDSSSFSSSDSYRIPKNSIKKERKKAEMKRFELQMCNEETLSKEICNAYSPRDTRKKDNENHEKENIIQKVPIKNIAKSPSGENIYLTSSGKIIRNHTKKICEEDKRIKTSFINQAFGNEPEVLFQKRNGTIEKDLHSSDVLLISPRSCDSFFDHNESYDLLKNETLERDSIEIYNSSNCIFIGDDIYLYSCYECTVIGNRIIANNCQYLNIYGDDYKTGDGCKNILARGSTKHHCTGILNDKK